MISLRWSQVNAWRLSRQYLSSRLPRRKFSEAVSSACGIQAQVMSAAETAIWARTEDVVTRDIRSALWEKRTLVKTWAMRATLHLLTAADLPLYVAAREAGSAHNWSRYFTFFGMNGDQGEAMLAALPEVLGEEPVTRQELAAALARNLKSHEIEQSLLGSSWGSLWKPSAWKGDLCFGPNRGQNPTFVNPHRWLGEWKPLDPYPSLQEILRRYLHTYGPATPKQFALWWNINLRPTQKLFESIANELEQVDLEGWTGWVLKKDIPSIQASEPDGTVHLLPLFDAYLMGLGRGKDIEPLLGKELQKEVFRPQGWISSVVLVDGFIRGRWEVETHASFATVKVDLFSREPVKIHRLIEAEAGRLSSFLGLDAEVEISSRLD
jgi:hypothetical protein